MFKVIGAIVVYGFALFGLSTYLDAKSSESNHAGSNASGAKP
jgi:hypothetical protein